MPVGTTPTLLIVPGLRDHVEQHWQTLLAARLPHARTLPPMERDNLGLTPRINGWRWRVTGAAPLKTWARWDISILRRAVASGHKPGV
jgi:predicted alpha/beta hydrolase family esterase